MCTLAHALGIFTWFLGPMIIWLIKKDDSKFVDHHGKEALNFWIVVTAAIVISFPLMYICIGVLTYAVAQIGGIVFAIIASIEASKKKSYFYPITIRLIK